MFRKILEIAVYQLKFRRIPIRRVILVKSIQIEDNFVPIDIIATRPLVRIEE